MILVLPRRAAEHDVRAPLYIAKGSLDQFLQALGDKPAYWELLGKDGFSTADPLSSTPMLAR